MKNYIVVISVAITLLCGLLLFEKNREAQQALARADAAEKKREAFAVEAARQGQTADRQLRESRTEAFKSATAMQQLRQQLATNQSDRPNHKDLSDLFHDEAMQAVLRSEVKSGTARRIKALFDAGLAQQLKLNDDQAATLKQLLTQRMSLVWNQMLIPKMTGELDESTTPAAAAAANRQLDDNMMQLRALLGDDGYATWQWFEKTQPARDTLKELGPQFAEAGHTLNADQQHQLLEVMTSQIANYKYTSELGNLDDPAKVDLQHWEDNFTDDKINAYFQERQHLNDQMAQNANSVLTAEQSTLFREYLTQQLLRAKFTARTSLAMSGNRR